MRIRILVLAVLLLLPQPSFSQESHRAITANGSATLTSRAEFALIHAQLKVVSNSVEESYQEVSRLITEIAGKLQPLGVTKEDLTASVIIQGTEYDWSSNQNRVSGYYSACSLQIKVLDIATTYRIHRELAGYQNLSIDFTEYGRKDEAQLQITVLRKALRSAEAKARAMAETMGAELGEVLSIREVEHGPVPMAKMEAFSARAAEDPGEVTTTGSVTFTGTVSVEFALK